MPQNLAPFAWSEDALRLRQFVYEHWADHGHGPNLGDVHRVLGLDRRRSTQALRELQLGICASIELLSVNGFILRFMPFASFPTPVKAYLDGEFHSFCGCAMETPSFSKLPPFRERVVTFESYCACCMEPLSYSARNGEVLEQSPGILVHVSSSPWDWQLVDTMYQCDSMNFVAGPDHAEEFERQVCRRGVLFDLQQAKGFAGGSGDRRWVDYHWPPEVSSPTKVIEGARSLGVDVTNWAT